MVLNAGNSLPFYRSVIFKFWTVVALTAVPLLVSTAVFISIAWPAVAEQGRLYLFAAGVFAWFAEAVILVYIYRMWIHPVKVLSRGIEIINLSNRLHEIDIYTGDEMEQAARHAQAVGRMLHESYARLDAQLEDHVSDIHHEKASLSRVLDTIGAGVVVVNLDGLITLCNRQADIWIDDSVSVLGRSIFHYFERASLTEAMDIVHPDSSAEKVLAKLNMDSAEVSAVYVSPYFKWDSLAGYVLTLWPAPHHMESKAANRKYEERPEYYDFNLLERASESDAALSDIPLDEVQIVVFDTETTGLQPSNGDKIISIGAVRIRNGKIRQGEVFETLVNPEMKIPPSSIRFHNITDNMVEGKPKLSAVLPDFSKFCEGAALMGHNVAFDMKFLNIELEREGMPPLGHTVLDTLLLSYVLHDHYEDHNLKSLAERLGIPVVGLHTALGDAMMTADVFLRLVPILKNRGVNTVGEAAAFSKKAFGIRKEQKKF